jgi:hypothetical protein
MSARYAAGLVEDDEQVAGVDAWKAAGSVSPGLRPNATNSSPMCHYG